MERVFNFNWKKEPQKMIVKSKWSNGILFDTSEQVHDFFQELLEDKIKQQQEKLCLSKQGYDIEMEDTLDENLQFKGVGQKIIAEYACHFSMVNIEKKIKTYTPYEISIARLIYATADSNFSVIDGLYETLENAECETFKKQIVALQEEKDNIIIQILSNQEQGKYCDNLMAISADGTKIVPLKQKEK